MNAPIWSIGYRAFFWLGALNAVASIATWLGFLSGHVIASHSWPLHILHAHEMLHGTVVPAIAGFLLTAVPNWCGTTPLRGGAIAGLVALWLAGRLAFVSGGVLPQEFIALLDGAFLPVLALVVGGPILRSGKIRNIPIAIVVLALAIANAAMHVGIMQMNPALLRAGLYGSVYLVIFLILIIAGRIVPLFTANALRNRGLDIDVQSNQRIGALALGAAGLALIIDLVDPGSSAGGVAALIAAPLLVLRQGFWKPHYCLGDPMLWILHVGHGWVSLGFACHGAAVLAQALPGSAALHAFTAGAMGAMILAMMARVSLGHSGRPVKASNVTTVAFVAVVLGGLVRVFGPALLPLHAMPVLLISGAAFALGYLLFVMEFTPMLWRARVDGR